jgi:hypothetical protein
MGYKVKKGKAIPVTGHGIHGYGDICGHAIIQEVRGF